MSDKQKSTFPSANPSKNSERQFVAMINRLEKGDRIGNICCAWPGKETIHTSGNNSAKLKKVLRQELRLL
jgi:hypothetical protein